MQITFDLTTIITHHLTYICLKSGMTPPDRIISALISEKYQEILEREKALSDSKGESNG